MQHLFGYGHVLLLLKTIANLECGLGCIVGGGQFPSYSPTIRETARWMQELRGKRVQSEEHLEMAGTFAIMKSSSMGFAIKVFQTARRMNHGV
jgi:hypothetical protein